MGRAGRHLAISQGIQPFFQSSSGYFDSERARPLSDETARGRATERVPAPGPYMYYTRAASTRHKQTQGHRLDEPTYTQLRQELPRHITLFVHRTA